MVIDIAFIRDLANLTLTLVLTVATVYLAVYTYRLVKEARVARKASLQPSISIHLEPAETDPTLLFIVVRNIGPGIAYNLTFNITQDIGDYEIGAIKIGLRGLFKEGMKFCPPGYSKKYFLMETTQKHENKFSEELVISANYSSIFKDQIEETFHISLKEQWMSSSIKPADTYMGRIVEHLKDIRDIIERNLQNNQN
jgi:hypothetical protein